MNFEDFGPLRLRRMRDEGERARVVPDASGQTRRRALALINRFA